MGDRHHQLPEAPPPPDDPPPPEKPPPEDPPQDEPPLHDEPPRPLFELAKTLSAMFITYQRKVGDTPNKIMKTSSATTSNQLAGSGAGWLSSRSEGRFCHSEASVVRTVMMSSTPRVMPSPKSPALKRGAIALVMITFDSASVRVPSSP